MKKLILMLLMIVFSVIPYTTVKANIFISGRSAILVEQDSMRILYTKHAYQPRPIASTTKIMTAILAIESGKMDDIVTVGNEVLDVYGSAIYVHVGEKMILRDLVYGLMLKSGNDAAVVIAKHVSGSISKFVEAMNIKSTEIGMRNTTFTNPHGLDDGGGNLASAYDMARLTSYAMQNSEYRLISGTKKHIVKTERMTYIWYNKNKLLFNYKYTTGGKPGYTDLARRTLVTTAEKDGLKLICVTLNAPNDWSDHKNLYEYGFNTYNHYTILDRKKFKVVDDYFYRDKLYIKKSFNYPLTKYEKDKLLVKIWLHKIKDYREGEKVGYAEVYLRNELLYKEDIYTHLKSPHKDLITRIVEWFKNLW